jgi:hypothetical protein
MVDLKIILVTLNLFQGLISFEILKQVLHDLYSSVR